MAKVKKMAFGGMGKTVMPGSRGAPTPVKPGSTSRVLPRGGMERKPMPGTVMTQPGFKPLPPGSIGMPGGPGGKTVYNTGPAPKGGLSGGPIGTTGFKQAPVGNMASHLAGGPAQGIGAAMSKPNVGNGPVTDVRNIAGLGNMLGKGAGMKKGGAVGSASKRADGIAQRGKTRA